MMAPASPTHGTLPALTEHRVLPEGVHDGSLVEVERLFGASQRGDHRRRLLASLRRYLDDVQRAGWGARVIIDGSFVMAAVEEPEDIDLILVLSEDWDMAAEVRPFEYNLISWRRTRRLYGFDVIAVRAGSLEEQVWLEFFQQVNVKWNGLLGLPPGLKKGIVRVSP